ncbi:MAG TPA: RodZ domain-containing protein [Rubrobacteraceae bacterium]|nr:RodZ domain-containing protein [Rubrobacteraceae bacterium]
MYERDGGLEIGPTLEKARLQRELTLDEVEQATKIRKRYIQAIEKDDYGVLPDAVYVQGFVKTYANYLGLNGEELAGELRSRRQSRRERHVNHARLTKGGFDKPLINPGGVAGAEKRRISGGAVLGLLASILLIVLVIGALYYVGRGSRVQVPDDGASAPQAEQADKNSDKPESGKPDAGVSSTGSAGTAGGTKKAGGNEAGNAGAETPAPVEVAIQVEGSPAWISVKSDGTVVYEQVADPGFSDTFEGEQTVGISTGNAGAVKLKVNGKDEGAMGGAGEVVSREFTPESES